MVVADMCEEQAGPFFSCTVGGVSDCMVHVVPSLNQPPTTVE